MNETGETVEDESNGGASVATPQESNMQVPGDEVIIIDHINSRL